MKYFLFFSFSILALNSFANDSLVEHVVVTATQHEQSPFDVNASLVVINKADIFLTQPTEIPEIFEYQSGAQIVRSGGGASQTSLFTRGTSSDHTMVLIDGIRLGSVSNGQAQLQFLDPEQIERIEYVKGPRSALYGSDAIGGVLQVFTLKQVTEREAYLTAQAGSQNTSKLSVGIKDGNEQVYYSAAISSEKSDGIDNLIDDTVFNSDNDPYEKLSANLGVGFKINDKTDLSFRLFESRAQTDFDSPFSGTTNQPYSNEAQRATSVMLKSAPASFYSTKLTLGHAREDSENRNFQDALDISEFNSERSSAYWLNSFYINEALTWDAGLDYVDESVDSTTVYQDTSRDNVSAFTQLGVEHGRLSASAGLRNDDSSDFGSQTSGSASLGWKLNDSFKLYASWGEGFKAPTFNDLYWPSSAFSSGNPNLVPETSESVELGFKVNHANAFVAFNVYKMDVNNLIDWAPNDDGIWMPTNISSAEIEGAELDVKTVIKSLSITSTLSYTDAVDAETGDQLDNRAKTKFTLNLSQKFGNHAAGVLFRAVGKRQTSTDNELPGYGTVGLFARSKLSDKLSVRLKVDNLFDREYEVREGYNEPGLEANAKVTYKF